MRPKVKSLGDLKPKYFDRKLSREIVNSYPTFLRNRVPESFKKKILLDSTQYSDLGHDESSLIKSQLNELGIAYQCVSYYFLINENDWNFIKLIEDEYLLKFEPYKGSEIGPLLLNEINRFLK